MSLRLSVSRAAQTDVVRVSRWYESEDPGLGEQFLRSIDDHLDTLVASPFLQPRYGKGSLRRRLLAPWPYFAYFRIESDSIEILAFIHTSRHPSYISKRVSS
jgi:toxin ParE1/3/4